MSPALQDGFFTTGPPGKFLPLAFNGRFYLVSSNSGSASPRGNTALGITFFQTESTINFNKTPNFIPALLLG